MSEFKSTQLSGITNGELTGNQVELAVFDYTVPAGGHSIGISIDLCEIPENARLVTLHATASKAIAITNASYAGASGIFTSATSFTETDIQGTQDVLKSARMLEKRISCVCKAVMAEADVIKGAITYVKGR